MNEQNKNKYTDHIPTLQIICLYDFFRAFQEILVYLD